MSALNTTAEAFRRTLAAHAFRLISSPASTQVQVWRRGAYTAILYASSNWTLHFRGDPDMQPRVEGYGCLNFFVGTLAQLPKFVRDVKGVIAVELAIIGPILVLASALAVHVAQLQDQKYSTQFLAQACSASAANVLHNGGTQADAAAQAQAVFAANIQTWKIVKPDAPTITFSSGLVTVQVHAVGAALFPLFADQISTDVSATS